MVYPSSLISSPFLLLLSLSLPPLPVSYDVQVSSMIEVSTERVFLHASALESILQTSAVCHVIMRHPSLYNEFLRRMEASWLNSRAFAVLRLARATHACLLRMRMSDPRSLPISDYFDTRCATFTSVLGRPVRAGDTQRMIDDAQRMNAQRRLMCVETPDACAQLWMVMFLFVEWTCDALLALIFTSKRSVLSPLAEYPFYLILYFIFYILYFIFYILYFIFYFICSIFLYICIFIIF